MVTAALVQLQHQPMEVDAVPGIMRTYRRHQTDGRQVFFTLSLTRYDRASGYVLESLPRRLRRDVLPPTK